MNDDERDALDSVGLKLRSLLQRFKEANADNSGHASDVEVRLSRSAMQLHALVQFIESFQPFRAECEPIRQLNVAMFELLDGRKSPLLESVLAIRSANRPGQSVADENARTSCAVALDMMMKIGRKKLDAAKVIAARLNKTGFRLPGDKPVNGRTVISWRDSHVSGAVGSVSELATHAESEMKRMGRWPLSEDHILKFLDIVGKPTHSKSNS